MVNKKIKPQKRYVAIDFGTTNTKVYMKDKDVFFKEATLVAFDIKKQNKIIGIGNVARNMIGKSSTTIVKAPLKNGAITDINLARKYITNILDAKGFAGVWRNSYVLLTCPENISKMERDALHKMCKELGTKYTEIESDIKLALVGAGYDINDGIGRLVLDLGGGKTTAGIVVSGDILMSKTIKKSGSTITGDIQRFIKSHYTVSISADIAEDIKKEIACLAENNNDKEMLICGRDVVSGLPKEVYVNGSDIHNVLVASFIPIVDLVSSVLANTTSETVKDIVSQGIILAGGGARLNGIKEFLKECFKMKIIVPKDPELIAIKGAKLFENEVLKNFNKIEGEIEVEKDENHN